MIALSIEILRLGEQTPQAGAQPIAVSQFALPHFGDAPPRRGKRSLFAPIAGAVGLDLRLPIVEARLGELPDTASMAVPKAAMHE